jgi:hypothetical protein
MADEVVALLLRQRIGPSIWGISKDKGSNDANEDGGDALKEEDLPPTLLDSNPVHLGNRISQQARESTRKGGSCVDKASLVASSYFVYHLLSTYEGDQSRET